MSQENIEIHRLMGEAWNRQDFEDALQYLDPEVDFRPGILPPGERTRFLGHEGVREWIGNLTDTWVKVTFEPKERFEIGSDRILAIDRWLFRGRAGIEIEEELPTAYTFRNGLIVRVHGFTDKSEALKAVGLQE
jgi:ketosteroid isomerase-like protein